MGIGWVRKLPKYRNKKKHQDKSAKYLPTPPLGPGPGPLPKVVVVLVGIWVIFLMCFTYFGNVLTHSMPVRLIWPNQLDGHWVGQKMQKYANTY